MASRFCVGAGNGNYHGAAGAYAGGVVTGALFAAAGGATCVVAVLAAGVFVGEAGTDGVGMECYLAAPEPPPGWFGLPTT